MQGRAPGPSARDKLARRSSGLEGTGVDLPLYVERPGFALFLGAGASKEAGYPLMVDLTRQVITRLPPQSAQLLKAVMENTVGHPWNLMDAQDLEEIADHLETQAIALGRNTKLGSSISELLSQLYAGLREQIRAIRPNVNHHVRLFQALKRLRGPQSKPIWVFTTNYDILVELAAARCELPVVDGFIGSYPRVFRSASYNWRQGRIVSSRNRSPAFDSTDVGPFVVLFKLHGSINWWTLAQPEPGVYLAEDSATVGDSAKSTLIAPRRRKEFDVLEFPYNQIWRYAANVIGSDCKYVVTCGYSFRDEHINDMILVGPAKAGRIQLCVLAPDRLAVFDQLESVASVSWATAHEVRRNGQTYEGGLDLWRFSSLVRYLCERAGIKEV